MPKYWFIHIICSRRKMKCKVFHSIKIIYRSLDLLSSIQICLHTFFLSKKSENINKLAFFHQERNGKIKEKRYPQLVIFHCHNLWWMINQRSKFFNFNIWPTKSGNSCRKRGIKFDSICSQLVQLSWFNWTRL